MRDGSTAPMPCRDQRDLLRAFDLPIALMQDAAALERVTHELVEDVASDGTLYVEIRWAPSLTSSAASPCGTGIAAVVAGARVRGAATGIVVRLIAVALRTLDPDDEALMARGRGRLPGRRADRLRLRRPRGGRARPDALRGGVRGRTRCWPGHHLSRR